jgi:hypothetical protein
VPSGRRSTTSSTAINRVFLPRADIATETLVAGLQDLGWEVDDVTAYRTVRARAARRRDAGATSSPAASTRALHLVLDGPQPRRHRRQAAPSSIIAVIGPQTAKTPRSTACGSTSWRRAGSSSWRSPGRLRHRPAATPRPRRGARHPAQRAPAGGPSAGDLTVCDMTSVDMASGDTPPAVRAA